MMLESLDVPGGFFDEDGVFHTAVKKFSPKEGKRERKINKHFLESFVNSKKPKTSISNDKGHFQMFIVHFEDSEQQSAKVPSHMYKKVIALEGEIGAGKSTLSLALRTEYTRNCSVYEEQTNQGFLSLFYSNPAKYGFAFQWGMLKTRLYQLRLAQHDALTTTQPLDKFYMWDRSMIGDYIFCFLESSSRVHFAKRNGSL